jgi:hypothetical protein
MSDDKNPKITLTTAPEIKVNVIGSGPRGMPGKSAYQIWLEEGNAGSKEDFFESLRGADGVAPDISHVEGVRVVIGKFPPTDSVVWVDTNE